MISEREKSLVAALRSGEYEQTTAFLKTSEGYCCLGVACDISEISVWNDGYYCGLSSVLPNEVREYYNWKSNKGFLRFHDREKKVVSLPVLNDVDKLTFNQIADLIEAGLVLRDDEDWPLRETTVHVF